MVTGHTGDNGRPHLRQRRIKISVDSKTSAQSLSDELSLKDFGGFSVEVMSSTANSLELKVVPK